MKDFIDLVPFFQSYGQWVRWLIVVWILFTSSLASVLLFADRTGVATLELSIDALRVVSDKTNKSIAIELIVRNSLPHLVQLTELQVSLYGENKPAGGLQSSTEVTTTYEIKKLDSGEFSVNELNNSNLQYNLNINYPYYGQNYLEMKIPVAHTLSSNSSDRFIIQFLDADFVTQYHKNLEVIILYNGDQLSKPKITML